MPDYADLLKVMKQAARETEHAGCPVQVCFGRVINTQPLKIMVEQKIILGQAQLILSQRVTDYEVECSATADTERSKQKIYNALAAGEEVLLLRMQGGQKYIVLDRMVKE